MLLVAVAKTISYLGEIPREGLAKVIPFVDVRNGRECGIAFSPTSGHAYKGVLFQLGNEIGASSHECGS